MTSAKSSSSSIANPNSPFNRPGSGPGISSMLSMALTEDLIAAMQSCGAYSWMGSKYCGKLTCACVTAIKSAFPHHRHMTQLTHMDSSPLLAIAPQTSSGYCVRMWAARAPA